jgi:hypothetical protein
MDISNFFTDLKAEIPSTEKLEEEIRVYSKVAKEVLNKIHTPNIYVGEDLHGMVDNNYHEFIGLLDRMREDADSTKTIMSTRGFKNLHSLVNILAYSDFVLYYRHYLNQYEENTDFG